jgi:hypothetical protein
MVIQLPRTFQTITIRGTRVSLECFPKMLPCILPCASDADCALNGPISRCVDGMCEARLGCN